MIEDMSTVDYCGNKRYINEINMQFSSDQVLHLWHSLKRRLKLGHGTYSELNVVTLKSQISP